MKLIVQIDSRYGTAFLNRILSTDITVTKDMINDLKEKEILVYDDLALSSVSKINDKRVISLKDYKGDIETDDNLVLYAVADKTLSYIEHAESITVYNWNRDYPADTFLNKDYIDSLRLISESDFTGNSHEKITKRRYENEQKK